MPWVNVLQMFDHVRHSNSTRSIVSRAKLILLGLMSRYRMPSFPLNVWTSAINLHVSYQRLPKLSSVQTLDGIFFFFCEYSTGVLPVTKESLLLIDLIGRVVGYIRTEKEEVWAKKKSLELNPLRSMRLFDDLRIADGQRYGIGNTHVYFIVCSRHIIMAVGWLMNV